MPTNYTMNTKEAEEGIVAYMEAGIVPMVAGSPGIGKSAIVSKIAKDHNLELIDLRLSQCAPEDLMGLPMRVEDPKTGKARSEFVPFSTFPLESDPLPKGRDGWLLFLDEFNSAPKSVQLAAYKVVNDHEVGLHKLHPNCVIVCAGNLESDRAITTSMSTAMQSRLGHIQIDYDHDTFMNYIRKSNWDHRIQGFLEFQPAKGHHFNPEHNDRTFACPRTWDFVNRYISGRSYDEISVALLAGLISDGVAVELHAFMQEYGNLPSYASILMDPEGEDVPPKTSTRYALTTMLLGQFKKEDFSVIGRFVKRLPAEFQVLYFRGALQQCPKLRHDPTLMKLAGNVLKHLSSSSDDLPEDAFAA